MINYTLSDILLTNPFPDKRIITVDKKQNKTVMTYGELAQQAKSAGAALQSKISKGSRVIISISDTGEFIKAFWSVILAGGTAVPVTPPLDGVYAEEKQDVIKLGKIVRITGAELILCGDAERSSISKMFPDKEVLAFSELVSAANGNVCVNNSAPEDIALIVFTSGSTGDPKGAPLSHRNVIAGMISDNSFLGYDDKKSFLNWFPLEHVVPLIIFHIMPLMLGSEQVHISPVNVLADITSWLTALDRFGTNVSWAPNFAYGMLLEAKSRIAGMDIKLDNMYEFMNGGEAIHAASSLECMEILAAKGLRSNAMIPIWGMSEVAVGMTFTRKFGENLYKNSVSVGEVTSGYEIRITNGETVIENDDIEGDIEVRGEPVFSGYINYDNSLCFTPDGWFRTGDVGVWKNGEIVICGRSSENFIQNGVNISLQEITSFIQNEFSAKGLSFTLRTYAVKNDDTQRDELAVFTELPDGMTEDETVDFILEKLRIRYSFGFRYITFLDREEFPRTPLGKIDKKVLLRRFKDGEYEVRDMQAAAVRDTQSAEELSDDQRMMLYLWADNLGINPTELTVEDAYFTIGGNSAKAAALLEKVNELFKCSVPAMDFVKFNTINALLEYIKGDAHADTAVEGEDCEFIVL